MNVGDTLELVMEADTAGYAWDIGFNVPAVLKVSGEPSSDPGSKPGGTDTFHLTAVGEGEESVRLIYRTSIEGNASPLRICDIKVIVTK